jgi:hypothetical protein
VGQCSIKLKRLKAFRVLLQALKDRAMAESAEYGLMLWDQEQGHRQQRRESVPRSQTSGCVRRVDKAVPHTIKTFDDIKGLLAQGDSDSVERIVSELHLHVLHRAAG